MPNSPTGSRRARSDLPASGRGRGPPPPPLAGAGALPRGGGHDAIVDVVGTAAASRCSVSTMSTRPPSPRKGMVRTATGCCPTRPRCGPLLEDVPTYGRDTPSSSRHRPAPPSSPPCSLVRAVAPMAVRSSGFGAGATSSTTSQLHAGRRRPGQHRGARVRPAGGNPRGDGGRRHRRTARDGPRQPPRRRGVRRVGDTGPDEEGATGHILSSCASPPWPTTSEACCSAAPGASACARAAANGGRHAGQ